MKNMLTAPVMMAGFLFPMLLCFAGNDPAVPANLLENPSFAEGLRGWEIDHPYPGPTVDPTSDRSISHDGDNACVGMMACENLWTALAQSVPICPGIKRYQFSAYAICKDMSPDWVCGIQLAVYKNGRWLRNIGTKRFAASDKWMRLLVDGELRDDELNSDAKITMRVSLLLTVGAKWLDPKADPGEYKKGGMAFFDDIVLEPVEDEVKAKSSAPAVSGEVEIEKFHALGEAGIFLPGEPVKLQLEGRNNGDKGSEMEVGLKVIDFFGNPVMDKVEKVAVAAKSDFRQVIELAPPQQKGYFLVKPEIRGKGGGIHCDVIGFCVIEPVKEKDPFFVGQGDNHEVLKALDIIGVTGVPLRYYRPSPENTKGKEADFINRLMKDNGYGGMGAYWGSSLNLIGYISLEKYPKWVDAEIKAREAQGLPPYSEEFYTDFGDYVELLANVQKEKVKTWVLGEEIDLAYMKWPNLSQAVSDERYVRMAKIAYERLKRVDPACTVIGLTVTDCLWDLTGVRTFQSVRRLLPRLKGHLDMLGPDTYNSSYFASSDSGPEVCQYRKALLKTVDFQKQLGKSSSIAISESGVYIPYHYPLDHEYNRYLADQTARNLIITKSVPNVLFYALHNICLISPGLANLDTPSDDRNPVRDFSLYKVMPDPKFRYTLRNYLPRSAVVAYATVARMLGNATATDPAEFNLQDGFYCYMFERKAPAPAGLWDMFLDLFWSSDPTIIAAMWTTDKSGYTLRIELPAEAELCDLMGNTQACPPGKLELGVSESPVFLACETDAKTFASAINAISFPSAPLVKGEAHLADISNINVYLRNKTKDKLEVTVEADQLKTAQLPVLSKTTTIPAFSEDTVRFEITGMDVAKPETFSGRIKARDQVLPVTCALDAIPVAKRKKAGKLDGDLAKYEGMPSLVLNGSNFLYPLPAEIMNSRQWTGTDGLSVSCHLAWDDKYFYIAAQVKDDTHLQRQTGGNIWKDDCFQFAFDTLNNALSSTMARKQVEEADDYTYGLALTAKGPQCYCWTDKGKKDKAGLRNFPLTIKREGNETIYELAIPWENLSPLAPKAGKAFAFSFVVFDIDDPALGQASYWMGLTKGIAGGKDPSAYKTFILME